jgi:protein gp37
MYDSKGIDPNIVRRTSDATFYQALSWKQPKMIFTNSMSDFFIEEADQWRDNAWEVIRKTPQHKWQILTKRPERIKDHLPKDWGTGWDHVWLGTSVESQPYINRIDELVRIPAKTRFVSFEPLIGPIDLSSLVESGAINGIHWGIIGGESGYTYGNYRFRPCEIFWIEDLVKQQQALGIKTFVKQLGTHQAKKLKLSDWKGENLREWPISLQNIKIQEFPA